MSDFRIDKIFLEPFIAVGEDNEDDILFGWTEDFNDLPEDFYEDDGEEDIEQFFFEKNLTNTGKL
jgi:hypothetical protein